MITPSFADYESWGYEFLHRLLAASIFGMG